MIVFFVEGGLVVFAVQTALQLSFLAQLVGVYTFGDFERFAHVFEMCTDECRCCPDQQGSSALM